MNKDIVRQIVVIGTYLFTLVSNGLANSLPLNNQTTGQVSDSFNVVFVPAGYVFSIWGIIYLALLVFTILHSLPSRRQNPTYQKIGYLFALSNILNGCWIYLWHYNYFALTLVIMFGLLVTLILLYLQLNIGKETYSVKDFWTLQFPFSIYLGWITVATLANTTAVLQYSGWNGFGIGGDVWTLILLIIAVGIAFLMNLRHRDWLYTLVLVWAFIGISVKWWDTYPLVVYAGFISAGVLLVCIGWSLWRSHRFLK